MIARISLPAAMSQDFHARRNFKQALLISFGRKTKATRPEIGSERLCMAARKESMRSEAVCGEDTSRAGEKRMGAGVCYGRFFPFNCYYFDVWKPVSKKPPGQRA